MMARISCSMGVIPERGMQLKKPTHTPHRRSPLFVNDRMKMHSYIPVPPAIIPTYFTVLVTGSDFLSGRIANLPGKERERENEHEVK